MNRKKPKKARRIGYRQIFLIITAAFWVIYPFIARVVINRVPEVEEEFFSNQNGYVIDLLLYCKEIALIGFTVVILLYFLGERIFPDRIEKLDKVRGKQLIFPLIAAGGYIFFSILSFIFCKYKETALFGVNSEYEGLLAIICYVGVFLFAVYYMKKPSDEKVLAGCEILKYGINILCLIIGLLSIIEVFWTPLLEIPFLQDIISSEKTREIAHSIKNENFIGQICLMFNNPGFLGGFCALFLPVNLSITLSAKKYLKIPGIIGTGLMGLSVYWSRSTVAMLSLVISIPLVLLLYIRKEKESKKPEYKSFIINIAVTVVIVAAAIVSSEIFPTYSSVTRGTNETPKTNVMSGDVFKLSKAEIKDGELYLHSKDKLLKISVDKTLMHNCYMDSAKDAFSKCLVFSDGERIIEGRTPATIKKTTIREETPGFKLTDERYKAITIATEERLLIMDLGYSGTIEFSITEKGLKAFGQGSVQLDEIPQPKITGLEKFYSFGTGRGYIWVQSLPIIADSILVGGGNGTFAFRFLQNEMVGLLNTHGSYKYVVDRPHNWYLQIICSDGLLAFICVAALFLWYIIRFIKRLDLKKKAAHCRFAEVEVFDIGLFAGILGFLICGMINDSCITVNPLFWLMLGTAVARSVKTGKGN